MMMRYRKILVPSGDSITSFAQLWLFMLVSWHDINDRRIGKDTATALNRHALVYSLGTLPSLIIS